MLYSGIDLHKRSLVIHTLDAAGATTREAQLKSDRGADRNVKLQTLPAALEWLWQGHDTARTHRPEGVR